jgi:hypothetical protein
MKEIFFTLMMCPSPEVVNKTKVWDEIDSRLFSEAIKRCEREYYEAPCLIRFTKLSDTTYTVLCGKKR